MVRTTPNNFLGLPERYSRYEQAHFAVLPVPYDFSASYVPGTRNGPAAIIAASHHVELFDEELERECHKSGIATLDAVEPNADGPAAMQKDLLTAANRVLRDGKFLFALGGDHSITAAFVQAARRRHRKLSVLQIDAHLDLRNTFLSSSHSHACVMRRVVDTGVPVVPVGIRAVDAQEHAFLKKNGIRPVTARDCHMEEDWLDRAVNALGEHVYVSIDIDAFDPAFAPGTGTPEPGGLDWYQVIGLLRLVAAEKNVVAADLVEVLPLPGQVVTEFLAARLVYKLIAYVDAAD